MANYTPLMRQYMDLKGQTEDCILFFRLGDFYEMFGEDAKIASKELDITLTTRDRSEDAENRIPMCGVPYHSSEAYIARLIAKGYKVAIAEQTEDPRQAQGLVRREVVRIITPGTVMDASMLDEEKNNFICSVFLAEDGAGICFADISTGLVYATRIEGDDVVQKVLNELGRYVPREAVMNATALGNARITSFLKERLSCMMVNGEAYFAKEGLDDIVLRQFGKPDLKSLGIDSAPETVLALGAVFSYLYEIQKTDLSHLNTLYYYDKSSFMELDYTARRNLEITQNLRTGEKQGSLLGAIDETMTSMGQRLLRSWLEKPLLTPTAIKRRHYAVDELLRDPVRMDELRGLLRDMPDIERLISRVVYGSANCRDLKALERACTLLPKIKENLAPFSCHQLKELYLLTDELGDIRGLVSRGIVDDPPFSVREGGIIKSGYHEEVDNLRSIIKNGRGVVADMEAEEREKTGIKTLKVGYNKVFGYYLEVSKSYYDLVPETYIRKQTLANCERYITQKLKDMEGTILGAQERISSLEFELFTEIREKIAGQVHIVQRTASALSTLDVLLSFAQSAKRHGYTMPEVDYGDVIDIKDGRHPVVEQSGVLFVPNDTYLDNGENMVSIITGPNMAGKSTYMRQTALIVLMAQAGSFVPAKSARIGIVDRVFTRIGASDDLSSGQSTFMVEMIEMANILKNATSKSLLILDEIGRGTSTFDGMSIARAALEYAADKRTLGAKTLFATHYHELTVLEDQLPGVKNYNIAVKKRGDEIIFLRKIVRGGTDDSYGIEVAKLAGVPTKVINRAREILRALEEGGRGEGVAPVKAAKTAARAADQPAQLSLGDMTESGIIKRLDEIDVNTITPIEALNILYELKTAARKGR